MSITESVRKGDGHTWDRKKSNDVLNDSIKQEMLNIELTFSDR
jgi:hypothetical protein